jgi:Leucine-rich repeat (LRR) protein
MTTLSDPTQIYQTGFDSNTNLFFYLNNITGESSWEEPEELRLPDGYQRGFDASTGRVYYGNVNTGEVSWEFPVQQQQQQQANVWEVTTDNEGRTFYFNTITEESQWDPPPELVRLSDEQNSPNQQQQVRPVSSGSGGSRPGSKRRRRRRKREGTPGSHHEDQLPVADDGNNPANWEINQDEEGVTFYYNLITGQTQWDEPEALQLPSGWVMEIDEASGNEFYFNDNTGESSWERPVRQYRPGSKKGKIRSNKSKNNVDISQMTEKQIEALDWEISKDGAGNPIYINIKSGEMVMEKPQCLVNSEDEHDNMDDGPTVSPEEQRLKEMSEEDWELVRENSEVKSVWGDWETYIHKGKPEKYDDIQKKEFEKRVKLVAKQREQMLEVREKRLKETKKRREEEDKKAAKMTLRMKRDLAKKREKEDQEEEKIQQEEDEASVPEPQLVYPPVAKDFQFWYHIKDDRCTYEDPILLGWSDGSTDGDESTDAPSDYETAEERQKREELEDKLNGKVEEVKELNQIFESIENEEEKEGYEDIDEKDAKRKNEISSKIVELKKEINKINESIKDVKEAWIRELEEIEEQEKLAGGGKKSDEDEGKKKDESKDAEDGKPKRRRRIKRRVRPRKDHYGDWRPIPKPPIRRTDKMVNRCFSHRQRYLDLTRQNLTKLPKRILTQTRSVVKHISFVGNSLKNITNDEINDFFTPMKNIHVLDFNRNFLKHLPQDIFKLKTLYALSCGHNKLEDIPNSLFLITNLTALSFNQNSLQRIDAELGVQTMRVYKVWEMNIGGLTNLTSLNLANNQFSTLPTHHESQQRDAQFGDLKALTHLNLSVNKFEQLPDEEFSRLISLTDLNFNENLFETFPSSICELSCMEKLYFAYNKLQNVHDNIGNLRHLQTLVLKNNHIVDLPNSFRNCNSLKILDISFNDIVVLPDFVKMNLLEELHCEHNQIERIPDSISGLKSLNLLNASHNKIEWMSPKIKSIKNVVSINLSYNNINHDGFPYQSFEALIKLTTLNLSHNEIKEIPNGRYNDNFYIYIYMYLTMIYFHIFYRMGGFPNNITTLRFII